jgi:hypothetical protein
MYMNYGLSYLVVYLVIYVFIILLPDYLTDGSS